MLIRRCNITKKFYENANLFIQGSFLQKVLPSKGNGLVFKSVIMTQKLYLPK